MAEYEVKVQRHPIRGALYGLLIGLSLAYFLFFQFSMFGFDTLGSVITKFVIVVLVGVAIGLAFAYLAPAKGPKEPPPVAYDSGPAPAAVDVHEEMPPRAGDTYGDGPLDDDEVPSDDEGPSDHQDDEAE